MLVEVTLWSRAKKRERNRQVGCTIKVLGWGLVKFVRCWKLACLPTYNKRGGREEKGGGNTRAIECRLVDLLR